MDVPIDELRRNRILASLPNADIEFLGADLRRRSVVRGEELCAPGAPIREIYFPFSGMVSIVATLSSGHSIEVGMVGRDGLVGVPLYPGARNLASRIAGQIAGEGVAIDPSRFWEASARSATIRAMTARATHAQMAVMAQTTACNSAHEVGPRLAKWLLISRDAAGSDALALTHEHLAVMIGAQRPTVTLAARRLQDAGIIDYRRGRIRIGDADALAREACECYAAVRTELDHLIMRPVVLQGDALAIAG